MWDDDIDIFESQLCREHYCALRKHVGNMVAIDADIILYEDVNPIPAGRAFLLMDVSFTFQEDGYTLSESSKMNHENGSVKVWLLFDNGLKWIEANYKEIRILEPAHV